MEVLLTAGAYSDYHILGLFKVPSREWMNEQWEAFKEQQFAEHQRTYYYDRENFVKWIMERGAEAVEQSEAYLGDYGLKKEDKITWT